VKKIFQPEKKNLHKGAEPEPKVARSSPGGTPDMGKIRRDFISFDAEFERAPSVKRTSIPPIAAGVNFGKNSENRGKKSKMFDNSLSGDTVSILYFYEVCLHCVYILFYSESRLFESDSLSREYMIDRDEKLELVLCMGQYNVWRVGSSGCNLRT